MTVLNELNGLKAVSIFTLTMDLIIAFCERGQFPLMYIVF